MTQITLDGVPFPFAPDGPEPASWTSSPDQVTIAAGAGTDLFVDPAGSAQSPDAFRLLGEPPAGDYQLSAKVEVGFHATFDAGVLLVHADERHWAKLCCEFTPQGEPSIVSVVTRGESDDANSFDLDAPASWLRVTRTGEAHAFHASEDGVYWRLIRYFALGVPARVGFLSQSPTGKGCTSVFSDIRFTPSAPKDLRDGT
ncbi:DUF1349 domain-containing protein [Actinokineospora guangxiensis]|uniref:DUF1349 domain-containing protein n=1 Tax=Actinokineospora guangxiensis TaxID=1490288 RepID=A0ABW0EWN1_9PSEU